MVPWTGVHTPGLRACAFSRGCLERSDYLCCSQKEVLCWALTVCLPSALLQDEVAQLKEEVHLLKQMKDMLSKELQESPSEVLSTTELRVQLEQKEQELDRAKEALQGRTPSPALSSPFSLSPPIYVRLLPHLLPFI